MIRKARVIAVAVLLATGNLCVADESETKSNDPATSTNAERPMQAFLGIGVEPLPPVLTSHLPQVIGEGRGILVSEVAADSAAEKAGLQKNDVLIRYDDQDLYSPEQLVKRVRNDQPGSKVELDYVRAGKLNTATVTLGEKPAQPRTQRQWPGFSRRFDMPSMPLPPDFLTEEQDLLDGGTEWTHFESMTLTKDADGQYRAKVRYQGEKGNSIEREYTGTRQDVREAIESDKELPEAQKKQLLRSLDDRGGLVMPDIQLPTLPNWAPWGRDPFSWPDVRF